VNCGSHIFLGALFTLALSWGGVILAPQMQLGQEAPVSRRPPAPDYPAARPGLAQQGLRVYRSLGCAGCHTQQVRPNSADINRGWGPRRTVARDFLYDQPVFLGTLRIGPDLANLAGRKPEHFAIPWKFQNPTNQLTELTQHLYQRLYDPRQDSPDAIMPSYPYLFEAREFKSEHLPVLEAGLTIKLNTKRPMPQQVTPKPVAQALAAYLLSLRAEVSLFEAPLPPAGRRKPAATGKAQ